MKENTSIYRIAYEWRCWLPDCLPDMEQGVSEVILKGGQEVDRAIGFFMHRLG
jgi:hypothetical protein